MTTCRCQSTHGVGAEPHSRSHQGHHPQPHLPRVPQKGVSAQRTPNQRSAQGHSPVLLPGPSTSSQPSPTHSPPAPEPTESEKVTKFCATLHSSGLCFFILSSSLSCVPSSLASGLENSSCVLTRDKCLARYRQPCSENSEVGELLRTGTRALRNAWEEEAAAQGEDGKGTGWDAWHLGLDCTLHLRWRSVDGQQSLGKP